MSKSSCKPSSWPLCTVSYSNQKQVEYAHATTCQLSVSVISALGCMFCKRTGANRAKCHRQSLVKSLKKSGQTREGNLINLPSEHLP
jgi:hypothetical protein